MNIQYKRNAFSLHEKEVILVVSSAQGDAYQLRLSKY